MNDGTSSIILSHLLYYIIIFLLQSYSQLCRYLHIPLGNVPKDVTIFGADLFFARHLRRQNHVLWASPGERPDLGGKELDDNRLLTDIFDWSAIGGRSGGRGDNWLVNDPGFFPYVCVELDIAALPVTALLQSHRIAEAEGASSAVAFDAGPLQFSVDEMVASGAHAGLKSVTAHDETALSANAFKYGMDIRSFCCFYLNFVSSFQSSEANGSRLGTRHCSVQERVRRRANRAFLPVISIRIVFGNTRILLSLFRYLYSWSVN